MGAYRPPYTTTPEILNRVAVNTAAPPSQRAIVGPPGQGHRVRLAPPSLLSPHELTVAGKTLISILVPLSSRIHRHGDEIIPRIMISWVAFLY